MHWNAAAPPSPSSEVGAPLGATPPSAAAPEMPAAVGGVVEDGVARWSVGVLPPGGGVFYVGK